MINRSKVKIMHVLIKYKIWPLSVTLTLSQAGSNMRSVTQHARPYRNRLGYICAKYPDGSSYRKTLRLNSCKWPYFKRVCLIHPSAHCLNYEQCFIYSARYGIPAHSQCIRNIMYSEEQRDNRHLLKLILFREGGV